jgi:hypothetical protein
MCIAKKTMRGFLKKYHAFGHAFGHEPKKRKKHLTLLVTLLVAKSWTKSLTKSVSKSVTKSVTKKKKRILPHLAIKLSPTNSRHWLTTGILCGSLML